LRNSVATTLFALVTLLSGSAVQAQAPAAPKGPQFVQIAPCLLFDTLTQGAENAAEETLRHVNVQTHTCGRVVPRYATRYSLSIVTYSRTAPEKVSAGAGPQVRAIDAPAPADGMLQFPVPNGNHVAVIIDGYWVAPGTPTLPSVSSGAPTLHSQSTSPRIGNPTAQSLHGSSANAGDIYLDGLAPYPGVNYSHVGVALIGQAATPNIVATLGGDGSSSGTAFEIYNTQRNSSGVAVDSARLMYVTGDATLRLPGFAIFSGRTMYLEGPTVPYNVVHDVSIINPRDAAGGATNRVTFFRSKAEFDLNSPATTKYLAYSRGDSGQSNINFDSQIVLHNGAQYHYRAFSVADPSGVGKDTFWVKAATNGDTITNTRADMWLSGNLGIGTTAPTTGPVKLLVEDLNNNTEVLVSAGDVPGTYHNPTLTLMHKNGNQGNQTQTAKYGLTLDATDGDKFKLLYGGTGAFVSTPALVVDTAGRVGIGQSTPLYPLSVTGMIQTSAGVQFPDGPQTAAYPFSAGTNTADLNRNPAGPLTSSVTNTNVSGASAAVLAAIDANGTSYLRLASTENPATRDWRIGMTDNTGVFRIRDVGNVDRMTISGSAIHFNGNVDGTTILATYQDLAEWVPAAETMPAGTVVVVADEANNTVTASTHAYDTSVAGVVSANPGLLLGVASTSKAKIATTGRVRVRVDATKSPIHKGDLLVTSDTPGMAMKSEPLDLGGVKLHRPGTLIGKALEPLGSGQGEILVLLSLQ
jgi:hypothetical protein